jgi:hypothetical protein
MGDNFRGWPSHSTQRTPFLFRLPTEETFGAIKEIRCGHGRGKVYDAFRCTILSELNEIWKGVEAEADDDDFATDFFEKFAEKLEGGAVVCFEITTFGMACGPVSFTVRIAINMNYCDDAENEE